MTLPLHPEAALELEAAVEWYAGEDRELASRFVAEVRLRSAQAEAFPRSGPRVIGLDERFDVRVFGLRSFPFRLVVASVRGARVLVAVAHTSRDPRYWRTRL